MKSACFRRGTVPLVFALLLGAAVSVRAQEPPPLEGVPSLEAPEARFLIESVSVEGTRDAMARIVAAETLIEDGGSYTEDDLRQAVARVHRLPFVLDATFSLRKGSVRDSYVLVVQVEAARWFFFERDSRYTAFDQRLSLESRISDSYSLTWTGLVGARVFLGRSGVLFASGDPNGVQAGYTQYDLFGTGAVATVGYGAHNCCTDEILPYGLDPRLAGWSWSDPETLSFSLGVPLSADRSVQISASRRDGEANDRWGVFDGFDFSRPLVSVTEGEVAIDRADLKWVLDTSDDPLLPSRGGSLSVGLEYTELRARELHAYLFLPDNLEVFRTAVADYDGELLTVAVAGTRHWSPTPRQTLTGSGRIAVGRSRVSGLMEEDFVLPDVELTTGGVSLGLRHLLRLWDVRGARGFGDLYLDSAVLAGLEAASEDLPGATKPLARLELSTGLVFRNPWGRIRLSVAYLSLGRGGR